MIMCSKSKLEIYWLLTLVLTEVGATNQQPFGRESFSIRTKISTNYEADLSIITELQESYSFEQKRSRIDYKLFRRAQQFDGRQVSQVGSYIYDQGLDFGLNHELSGDDGHCEPMKSDKFYSLIASIPDLSNLFPIDDESKFVLGPARVLLFVVSKLFDANEKRELVLINMKNIPAYWFRYQVASIPIIVYYTKASIDRLKENPQHEPPIPLAIDLFFEGNYSSLNPTFYANFQFSEIELIEEKAKLPINKIDVKEIDQGALEKLDHFAFSPSADCIQALVGFKQGLFSDKNGIKTQFSFEAQVKLKNYFNEQISYLAFVAYDGKLASLLVDRPSHGDGEKFLFDFKMNRYYHAKQRAATISNEPSVVALGEINLIEIDNVDCIISQLFLNDQQGPGIAELLLGGESFIYLGRAQVRGIQARLYQSADRFSKLPFWLENAVIYHEQSNESSWRERSMSLDATASVFVYLMDDDADGSRIDSKILKIEIEVNLIASLPKTVFNRYSISLYDFNWNLKQQSNGGLKLAEFFSLENSCLDSANATQFARVDLLLKLSKPLAENENLFDNLNAQNLALLGALRSDSKIPPVVVSNLESKLIKSKVDSSQAIKATFMLSEHSKVRLELRYFGIGSMGDTTQVAETHSASFRDCYLLAAHRKFDIHFAYDPATFDCFVSTKSADYFKNRNSTQDSIGPFKKVRDQLVTSPLEVYMTLHVHQEDGEFISAANFHGQRVRNFSPNLHLFDWKRDSELTFNLEHLNVHLMNGGNGENKKANKLKGFGLLVDNSNSLLVEPEPIEFGGESLDSEMTQARCHSKCVSNLNCKSYSICMRNFKLECVISNIQFDMKYLKDKFSSKSDRNFHSSNGKVTRIQLAAGNSVDLVKHSGCELFNKNYIDLFQFNGEFSIDRLDVYSIWAVGDISQCAEQCTRINLRVADEAESQADSVERRLESFNSNSNSKSCKNFDYLTRSRLYEQIDEANSIESLGVEAENMENFQNSKQIDGYCLYKKQVHNEQIGSGYLGINLIVDSYSFNPEFLYEKSANIRLLADETTNREEETATLQRLIDGRDQSNISEQDLAALESHLASGRNFVQTELIPTKQCAFKCFFQETNLWPACKSFDIVMKFNDTHGTTYCRFNSISLSEATGRKLVQVDEPKRGGKVEEKAWHFEPKRKFAIEASRLRETFISLKIGEDNSSWLKRWPKLNEVGVCGLILFGIVIGLLLGAKLCARFKPERGHQDGKSMINPDYNMHRNVQIN